MNYRQKTRRKINKKLTIAVIIVLFFISFYYLINTFAPGYLYKFIEPVSNLILGQQSNDSRTNLMSLFLSKQNLIDENNLLKKQIQENRLKLIEVEILRKENQTLKEFWGRKTEENTKLSRVLTNPNRSPYDTLIIDIGSDQLIKKESKVFASGGVLIGFVETVGKNSSIVRLISDPFFTTDGVLLSSNITVEVIGKGSGNLEASLPKVVPVEVGEILIMPDISSRPIAVVKDIEITQADSFQKLFLSIPVNIFELDWVEVEI